VITGTDIPAARTTANERFPSESAQQLRADSIAAAREVLRD
jgi:hypothetical protein